MADKELEINGVTYGEDTKVTLKVKTVAWISGILLSVITTVLTVGYFDMKSRIKEQADAFEKEKVEYKDQIKSMLDNSLKDVSDKRESMYRDIDDIKGDIKVILDRTGNKVGGGSLVSSPSDIPMPTRRH
jgi:hypothetical protein